MFTWGLLRMNFSLDILASSPRRELNSRPLPYQGSALPLCYEGWFSKLRAGEGTRTLDNQLGRLELYQLSYTRGRGGRWIRTTEGVKPADLQSAPFGRSGIPPYRLISLAELAVGLEPATS